eukprot:5198694-Prorocentrum_lima.AAC.1
MGLLVVRKGHLVVHVNCQKLLPQVLLALDEHQAPPPNKPLDLPTDIVHGLADTAHRLVLMITQESGMHAN